MAISAGRFCWDIDVDPEFTLCELERSTIFHGKTHYFDWAMFNSKLLNYQRVARNLLRACNLYTHVDVSAQSSWANVDIPLPWLCPGKVMHLDIKGQNIMFQVSYRGCWLTKVSSRFSGADPGPQVSWDWVYDFPLGLSWFIQKRSILNIHTRIANLII